MTSDAVVASLCRLAADFKGSKVSQVDLLRRSGYLETEPITEEEIETYLRLHPELVDAWIHNSRSTHLNGLVDYRAP